MGPVKEERALFTEEQVLSIKSMIEFSDLSNVEIAKIYNVGPERISQIRTGKQWGHL